MGRNHKLSEVKYVRVKPARRGEMGRRKNYRLTLATPKGSVVRADDHAMSVFVEVNLPKIGLTRIGALRIFWEEVFWEPVEGEKMMLWKGERELVKRTL